jgi:hypothetical protein
VCIQKLINCKQSNIPRTQSSANGGAVMRDVGGVGSGVVGTGVGELVWPRGVGSGDGCGYSIVVVVVVVVVVCC